MTSLIRQAAGAVVIVLTTWVVRAFLTATPSAPLPACVCGCPAEAHEHYRRGVDCGACGPAACSAYEASTEFEAEQHRAAVVYADEVEARAQQIHARRHRAGTASTCGSCLERAERELGESVYAFEDAEPPFTVSLEQLGHSSIEEYRTARAEMARRDAALGRPPLV